MPCLAPRWRRSKSKGQGLWLWRAVPPGPDFVALGMLATRTAADPGLSLVGQEAAEAARFRLVHRCLLVAAGIGPQVWSDRGSPGAKGGLWRAPSPCGSFFCAAGSLRKAPDGPFFSLRRAALPSDAFVLARARVAHTAEPYTQQLSFGAGSLLTLFCVEENSPWAKGWVNTSTSTRTRQAEQKEQQKEGLLPLSRLELLRTRGLRATANSSSAAVERTGKGAHPLLRFKRGERVLATDTSDDSVWLGVLAREPCPTAIGAFSPSCVVAEDDEGREEEAE